MNKRFVIGGGIIAVCGTVALWAFQGSITPYVSIAEARNLDRSCQVMGEIDKSSVRYDHASGVLEFNITDESHEGLLVTYRGVTPGNFDQAKDVVVSGRFDSESFVADRLLVKCPSKYQGLEEVGAANLHEDDLQVDSI